MCISSAGCIQLSYSLKSEPKPLNKAGSAGGVSLQVPVDFIGCQQPLKQKSSRVFAFAAKEITGDLSHQVVNPVVPLLLLWFLWAGRTLLGAAGWGSTAEQLHEASPVGSESLQGPLAAHEPQR